jgi:hypothetical protein
MQTICIDTTPSPENVDRISDFTVSDAIYLDDHTFGQIGLTGTLSAPQPIRLRPSSRVQQT